MNLNNELEVQELLNNPKFSDYLYFKNANQMQPSITQRYVELITKIENGSTRLFIEAAAGSGKTLMSLLVEVTNYRKYYTTYYNKFGIVKRIAIFGFLSSSVFRREMLKFPELGFITKTELAKLVEIRKNISNTRGNAVSVFEQNYQNLINEIYRRIKNPNYEGFFNFYGYLKWFNDLFLVDKLPEDITTYNVYQAYLDGTVKCNQNLLDSFKDALIVCDEIHMTYNTIEANTYAIALQMLLDYHGENITAIFLSATPINNQRREIIDLANMMRSQDQPLLKSSDYFKTTGGLHGYMGDNEVEYQSRFMKPIYDRFFGKTIFLEERSKDYPEIQFMGKKSPLITNPVHSIPMSPFHQHTFKKLQLYDETTLHTNINDMVYPNPDFSVEDHLMWHPNHPEHAKRNLEMIGLINTREIYDKYAEAPNQWINDMGITLSVKQDFIEINGPWLKKDNLLIYSAKYHAMVETIENELSGNPLQKFLIIHPRVQGSGVNQIVSILVQNGMIEYSKGSIANKETYSSEEFVKQKDWKSKSGKKNFKPATVFGFKLDVGKNQKDKILQLWNSPTERYGSSIKVLVGAKKIVASVDSKNTRHEFLMQVLDNEAERIQAFGRIIRTESMKDLPHDQRVAHIHMFMSVANISLDSEAKNWMTIEQKRYIRQDNEYVLIRHMLRDINLNAINNSIYRKNFDESEGLGSLSFKVDYKRPDKISLETYFDGNHEYALSIINLLVRRAFVAKSVWLKEELWSFVYNNPATTVSLGGVNDEVSHIYRRMFNQILTNIIYSKSVNIVNTQVDLFDSENKIFNRRVVNGKVFQTVQKAITRVGEYYILCPLDRYGNIEIYPGSYMNHHKKIALESTPIKLDSADRVNTSYISKYLKKYLEHRTEIIKANKHYLFLKTFDDAEHYSMMKLHINNNQILPDELFNIYVQLGIAGDDFYADGKFIHRFEKEEWNKYPHNIPQDREHNDIVVGTLKNQKFKIKEPTDEVFQDKRKIRLGQEAGTVKKELLQELHKKLFGKTHKTTSVVTLANQIFIKLVKLETRARSLKNGKRFLYLLDS